MAYDGAIEYVPVPGGKVSWSKDVKSPFDRTLAGSDCSGDGKAIALEAPVWGIVNDPDEELIFLDEPGRTLTQPTECVVLGKSTLEPSDGSQTHWVILVHCMSKDLVGSGPPMYERLGIAIFQRRHIDFQGRAREARIR